MHKEIVKQFWQNLTTNKIRKNKSKYMCPTALKLKKNYANINDKLGVRKIRKKM